MKANQLNQHPEKKELTEPVRYQILGLKRDLTPENRGRMIVPVNRNVPATDRVMIRVGKDDDGNPIKKPFHIAYVESEDVDGNAKLGQLDFLVHTGGVIDLSPNSPLDHIKYDYIERCNYNLSNPDRNPRIEAIFKRVSKEADAQINRVNRKALRKAITMAEDLSDEVVKSIGVVIDSIGRDKVEANTIEVIRDLVEDWAEKNPEKFIAIAEDKTVSLEATLKTAARLDILKHDKESGTFRLDDSIIYEYATGVGVKAYSKLAQFILDERPDIGRDIKDKVQFKTLNS